VLSGPPGRVTASVDIRLPRPRTAADIRDHPDYPGLRRSLWDALNDQVVPLAEPS
jgi:ABC-type nitrate/sulfonate/bicarbonate transport system ATPase subunit